MSLDQSPRPRPRFTPEAHAQGASSTSATSRSIGMTATPVGFAGSGYNQEQSLELRRSAFRDLRRTARVLGELGTWVRGDSL